MSESDLIPELPTPRTDADLIDALECFVCSDNVLRIFEEDGGVILRAKDDHNEHNYVGCTVREVLTAAYDFLKNP